MKLISIIKNHKIVSSVVVSGVALSGAIGTVYVLASQNIEKIDDDAKVSAIVKPQEENVEEKSVEKTSETPAKIADEPVAEVKNDSTKNDSDTSSTVSKSAEQTSEESAAENTKGTWVVTQFDEISNTCYASRVVYITANNQQWQDLIDGYKSGTKEPVSDTLVNKPTNEVLCISKV